MNQSSWVHLAAFIVPALLLSFLINIPKVFAHAIVLVLSICPFMFYILCQRKLKWGEKGRYFFHNMTQECTINISDLSQHLGNVLKSY